MAKPRLTFYCELGGEDLATLFNRPDIIEGLRSMQASLSLGLLDFSSERAEVVHRLNQAGIPVIAWLLLPEEDGYWCNLKNAPQTLARYQQIKIWAQENGLIWDGIGLDIEPDIHEMEQLAQARLRLGWRLVKRLFGRQNLSAARNLYHELVEQIQADGYRVDVYQLPIIVDERNARSKLLQRSLCLVDLPADREVLMLYTSFLRPRGPGFLWSYGPQAQSIGVGSTGGGVELGVLDRQPLSWNELARDLRQAWVFTNDIHIFSLEGCVRQGYFKRLTSFEWDKPIIEPIDLAETVEAWRAALQSVLWLSARPVTIVLSISAAILVVKRIRNVLSRR